MDTLANEFETFFGRKLKKANKKIQVTDWLFVGILPLQCSDCRESSAVFASESSLSWNNGISLVCLVCDKVDLANDRPSEQKQFIADFWKIGKPNFPLINEAYKSRITDKVPAIPETKSQRLEDSKLISGKPASQFSDEFQEYLDEGYKITAWIRLHEAQAVLQAYKSLSTSFARSPQNGSKTAEAQWFESGHPEQTRMRTEANVRLVRIRSSGPRYISWIHEYEAQAVVEAHLHKCSFDLEDTETEENIGAVYYAPDDSFEAVTYLTNTCLLRKKSKY